jgi:predicted extracellular nuclease
MRRLLLAGMPAVLVAVLAPAAAGAAPTGCDVPATHQIAQVQGSGNATPLAGQIVRVEGVVTGDFQAAGQLGGFFLQDDSPDADPATSDGLFAFSSTAAAEGDRVLVTGRAIEFNGLTELSPVTSVDVCGDGRIAAAEVDLPRAEGTTFERLENVSVTFPETLTATEHFQLGRFGEVTVSSDGRLFQPTDGHGDTQAENDRRRLLIDDGSTVQNPATVPYTKPEVLRLGDTVSGLTGVLGFGFGSYRLQPTETVSFTRANPRPENPAPVGGDVRVASFNTLNWFTSLGDRGADTPEERDRQLAKLVDAIVGLDADVLGLMEVENNGGTAVGALVDALNAKEGPGTYAYVGHPSPGTDAIKVEIIYKPAAVAPVGTPPDTSDPVHNRNPLVQTFERTGGSERFTLVVNHFKSKTCDGATGDELDQGDGQGCFNARRVAQANRLLAQLDALDVPDPLILGDLNAYTEEDPIHALEGGGFAGLSELFVPEAQRYSYVFDGQSGELDHALAGSGLVDNVSGTTIWHINADEPLILDYNTEFNPPGLYKPDRFRSSDHDPLLVGLELAQAPAAPEASALAGWGALTASWQPGDDGGSAITGYEVRLLARGSVVATRSLGPDARSATFGELDDGVPHAIEVVAKNAVGSSEAGTATATPFVPRRYTRLDARAACPAFTARNPNPFPVSASWVTSRGQTGTAAVPAGATVTLDARAPRGITVLTLLAGRRLQDLAVALC